MIKKIGFVTMSSTFFIWMGGSLGCAQPKYPSPESTENEDSSNADSDNDSSDSGLSDPSKRCQNRLSSHPDYCFNWFWVVEPTPQNPGSFVIEFLKWNDLEQRADLLDLAAPPRVFLWMPSMDHGSIPVIVRRESASKFQIDRVFFTMPGDWEIRIEIPLEGGQTGRVTIELWI